MTIDNKLKVLPLTGALADPERERGGADERALASIHRAIADAGTRAPTPSALAESADALRRRKLIMEIRMMRRCKINVGVEGLVNGATYGAIGMLLWYGVQALSSSSATSRIEARRAARHAALRALPAGRGEDDEP